MSDTDLNTLFQQAVEGYGKAYLDAESAIYAQGETAKQTLLAKVADTSLTPFARFIAATLADALGGAAQTYAKLDAAVGALEDSLRGTPLGTPPADIAAGTMTAESQNLSDLLALHLVKETDWPSWRALGAIIYLGYYAGSSVLPALEQFRADLKSGKHPALGEDTGEATDSIIAHLDEAANLVRIVIQDEAFKADIAKAQTATGPEQEEALQLAVVRALSLITADPARAKQLEDMSETFKTLVLEPVLSATAGSAPGDQVRRILADYLLGTGTHKEKPKP